MVHILCIETINFISQQNIAKANQTNKQEIEIKFIEAIEAFCAT